MSENEDYNKKIELIKTITDDQIKVPHNIPVVIYIQESANLYCWCRYDKEALTAKGFDWTVVEDLPVRRGALNEAESKWSIKQSQRRESENIWLKEASKGNDLRKELIHHFNYAFRNRSSLIEKVRKISYIRSFDGLIDGLNDLNVLGLENQELLKNIGFDFTLLDLAVQKSNDLAAKKEAASFYSENYLETKKIRDQAYTHLKEAVDYIREYARYVFFGNEDRLKGYRSNHLRKMKRRYKRRKNAPVPGPEPGPGPITIQE